MNNDEMSDEAHAVPAISAVPAALEVPAAGDGERIGRFTRAELEAMRGRRGRKPSEYHTLFPDGQGAAKPAKSAKASAPASGKAPRRGPKIPAVSSAVIGEHTIDELLAMIGSTGRKPTAFTILQEAAQVFADQRAIDLPPALDLDPLAVELAAAPKQVRETIAALLAAIKPRQPRAAKMVAAASSPIAATSTGEASFS